MYKGKRITTAVHRPIEYFCKYCHKTLHCPGLIDDRTGYPWKDFWFMDGAGIARCEKCHNPVV